ncbi:hypothetical protein JOE61_003850 [Nocardioides salarius]|uniref:Uncharacterized protein n=1 Tax=Nocardioides salarius TaxID=374513 RepID=A0ABS2MFS6_9ACTN|nr:hypothetical protein [Nocardioides salarius]
MTAVVLAAYVAGRRKGRTEGEVGTIGKLLTAGLLRGPR